MWWEKKPLVIAPSASPRAQPPTPTPKVESPMTEAISKSFNPAATNQFPTLLGQSVVLRGDLSGKEDLLIEGQLEGTLNFPDHCVTVGPHGQVKGEVHARLVIVQGSVNGNISAREKIEIRKSGNVVGDLVAAGIAIEDGAYFKGSIDISREPAVEAAHPFSTPSVQKMGA